MVDEPLNVDFHFHDNRAGRLKARLYTGEALPYFDT